MYELQVEKMSCGGCAGRVTKAVQAIDSAAKVDVDLAQRKARIESSAGIDAVKAAITAAGYPASSPGQQS